MEAIFGRQLANKLTKTSALLTHPRVARHVPPTSIYTPGKLHAMLRRYGTVVIKPQRGAGGRGVAKISIAGGGYAYSYYAKRKTYRTFAGLLRAIERVRRGKRYLIQRGIPLATIGGRPIDYRVKIVKTGGTWAIRAMVGRLARQGLFVTNLCRGGTQLTAAQGIRRSLGPKLAAAKKREMRSLTRTATAVLEHRFPGIGQLGFDYGLDRTGRIWIFEVNTRPQ